MPSSATAADIDRALLRLPYGEWIAMPEAARMVRELGLPHEALTQVVRTGRRRGVLRTQATPSFHLVKRICQGAHRPSPTLT